MGQGGNRFSALLLEGLDHPPQEADAVGAVDRAVIVGQRQGEHQPRDKLTTRGAPPPFGGSHSGGKSCGDF